MNAVFNIEDGVVTALAGGPISLADMGSRTTKRAGRVEFNADSQKWEVTDAADGELLFADPDYDTAIAWEIDHYNQKLLNEPAE